MTTFFKNCSLALAAAVLSGCAAYKIDPPLGFATVSDNGWETRMKAQDNVGLSVRRFDNVKGGTLAFWAADLVNKLGDRDYVLKAQSAVKTRNGKAGTRLDFDYQTFDTASAKFYTVVLVVTDKHKVVLQVAGDRQFGPAYSARVPEMVRQLVVRGCKPGSRICRGTQPPPLSTPKPTPKPQADPDPDPAVASPPVAGPDAR